MAFSVRSYLPTKYGFQTMMLHHVQAMWLQLMDTSSAGVVAAELAFLRAQLAELPALEQLDAAQSSVAGPDASGPLEAAAASQPCPAEADGAATDTSMPGSRPVIDRGSACQTTMQSVSGAGSQLDARDNHAGQPGALAEGSRVSGSLWGAPAASQSQGAWHADDSCAAGDMVSDGGRGMVVPSRT